MPTKRHTPEQIISKLREAEVLLSQEMSIVQACKKLGIHAQTYYRWRKEYGGVRTDQAKRLKDLEKENSRLKKLLAETGLRIGELQWLTWDDIDLGNNVVHVRPKRGWSTKTGNYRRVPLSGRAKETFCKLPRKWKWVVTAPASAKYPQGDRQISERRLLRVLKRLLKKLELNGHLHTFRHSFISRAVINGVPEAVIRQWVGHVDPRVLQLYTHIADAQSQQAMALLDECK